MLFVQQNFIRTLRPSEVQAEKEVIESESISATLLSVVTRWVVPGMKHAHRIYTQHT